MEESLIKKLITSVKCNVCGQHYKAGDVDVLSHEEDLWFLRVSCPDCDTHYLLAAIIKESRAPEVITDLTETELQRFGNMDSPIPDDVLDTHNFLKDFDGDFSQLFSRN